MLKRYFAIIRLVVLILPVCLAIPVAGNNSIAEYRMKSAFIYKFCKYTQWPAFESQNPDAPIVISILGKLPPGSKIQISSEKKIRDRNIILRNIKKIKEIDGSHAVYIASSEEDRILKIMEYVGEKSILTIGDTRGFCAKGVTFNMIISSHSAMIFEINREAIEKAGLNVHAQLFQMGRLVKTDPQAVKRSNLREF